MRQIRFAAMIAAALVSKAEAAEIVILAPPVVANAGVKDLAGSYTKDTGMTATVHTGAMPTMLKRALSDTPPPDLVALPSALMDQLEQDGAIVPGSRKFIGRVEIALVVPAGAPHPDISTPEKFVAVLKGAKAIAYEDPASGTMMAWIIQSMLARPEFQGVHAVTVPGNGVAAMLAGGEDMALHLADEVDSYPGASVVGPVPPVFGAHIDCEIAVSARSADPKSAAALIAYLLRPASDPVWKSKHLARR